MILIKKKDVVNDIFVTLSSRQSPIPSNTYTMDIFDDGFEVSFDIFDHNLGGQRSNLFNLEVVSNPSNEDLTNPNLIKVDIFPGEYTYKFTNVNGDILEWGIFKVLGETPTSKSYNYNPPEDKHWI